MSAKRTDQLAPGDRVEVGTFTVSRVVKATRQYPDSMSTDVEFEPGQIRVHGDMPAARRAHVSRLWIVRPHNVSEPA